MFQIKHGGQCRVGVKVVVELRKEMSRRGALFGCVMIREANANAPVMACDGCDATSAQHVKARRISKETDREEGSNCWGTRTPYVHNSTQRTCMILRVEVIIISLILTSDRSFRLQLTRSAARSLQQQSSLNNNGPGDSESRKFASLPARARPTQTKGAPPARTRAKANTPSVSTTPVSVEGPETRIEVPPPASGRLVPLPGRHPLLPVVYEVDEHLLVRKPHGKIYIGVLDLAKKAMASLFVAAANMELPNNREQLKSKDDYEVTDYEMLREDITGPPDLVTSTKAVKTGESYSGGIAFERHDRAVNIKKGPRCYQLATTVQAQKVMSAPGSQGKVCHLAKDKDAQMRFNVVKIGARAAANGVGKGPPGLHENLRRQAEVTALPPVGVDENVAWPGMQLNAAAAIDKESTQKLDGSLGVFGTAHVDTGDNAVPPTAMTILSKPHPNVEEEFFNVLDFGIAWEMEEFSTIFFSGLHFHGGSSSRYKKPLSEGDPIYYRLTVIAYPPTQIINAQDSVALAALPDDLIVYLNKGTVPKQPDDWDLGPGWTADNVEIGKDYTQLLADLGVKHPQDLPPKELALLCNSDSMTDIPFNNTALQDATTEWSKRLSTAKEGIPVCAVADGLEDEAIMGGRIVVQARKSAVKLARKEKNINIKKRPNPTKNTGPKTRKKAKVQQDPQIDDNSQMRMNCDVECDDDDVEMQGIENLLPDVMFRREEAEDIRTPRDLSTTVTTRVQTRRLTKGPTYDSKILFNLSSNRLEKTLRTVRAIANGVEADSLQSMSLEKMEQILRRHVITGARELWSMFRSFSVERCTSNLGVWLRQKQLLLLNMTIWEWLDDLLEDAYERGRHDPSSEVGCLLRRVEIMLETQPLQIRLDASDVLSFFQPDEAVFEQKQGKKRYPRLFFKHGSIFQIPRSQSQAWLVRELSNRIGPQVLFLNDIWKAAYNINTHVLGVSKNSRITKFDIQRWSKRYLAGHILTNRNSHDYKILSLIEAEVQAISSIGIDSTASAKLTV
ncbi:hypothetical protein GALMADRAFT_213585 [Galerina marginata CBS 339.88]|uniref:Uncharacterized protein n=1 Tax=Galerina marginata (strain CBS 339.88) TaxID=685588 RepID=A0A067SL93_GALM3|nr:hypothetical protein GALMADRAFT_213585 [Galerina marginata CBS 339.88]